MALSGGGLRSALFSIGVMKSLFDARQFDRFRVISTVSGGSYAAYWLYTNERAGAAGMVGFGDQSFGEINFNRRACELMATGNFVTYGAMLSRGLTRRGAVRLYDERIARTFGPRDTDPPARIAEMGAAGFGGTQPPYLIVNSTLIRPKPLGWRTGLYETSPLLAGNAEFRYLAWPALSPEMRTVVSVSGAAVQPLLKQEIQTPNADLARQRPVATDGGTSENLGAIALIRRGVRNVVVVDAEHDPRLRFGAYYNLRDRLRSYDAILSIPTIEAETTAQGRDDRDGRALHVGSVKSRAVDGEMVETRVFYLKMRISPALGASLRDEAVLEAGSRFHDAFRSAWQDSTGLGCVAVARLPAIPRSLFVYNVAGYGRYINERSPIRFTRRLPPFFRGQFPHYLTPDQSFYNDQVLAFIGLGYLEGEEVASAMAGTAP